MANNSKGTTIQFLHPGKTIADKNKYLWQWNEKYHVRRLFKNEISYLDKNGNFIKNIDGYFWGEWEATHRTDSEGDYRITTVEYPNTKGLDNKERKCNTCGNGDGKLNTDPYVFGKCFIYSNCQQHQYPTLRRLEENDVILFGSLKGGNFILDTVFVVDHIMVEEELDACSSCFQTVTRSLVKDGVYYKGKTYQEGKDEPFSFFPCNDHPFERPILDFEEISKQKRGIHYLKRFSPYEYWKKVKEEVEKSCNIGIWAKEPEDK